MLIIDSFMKLEMVSLQLTLLHAQHQQIAVLFLIIYNVA